MLLSVQFLSSNQLLHIFKPNQLIAQSHLLEALLEVALGGGGFVVEPLG